MADENKKAGQPTKYKPEYCEKATDHIAQGHSTESVGGLFDVCARTVYNWMDSNDEFLQAIKKGEAKRAIWLEQQIKDGLWGGKQFNAALGIFLAKNWLGMRDEPKEDKDKSNEQIDRLIDVMSQARE